ncbi:acetyl-CoA synthetase-like protein [Daedalea quercina L-15889]|uniref:Acetyl-CoA synthetase-like protein n=1 Tax=Daedalea quercina L-15889 TaxID=1314783 RepID=A0A165M9Q7_9APHY|nr:acetyl-CoA synthetase-like protein [Daedalea quercina L-15889]
MPLFHSKVELHVLPPDDVTLAQFILDHSEVAHPHRAERPRDAPWLIDEETRRGLFEAEVSIRQYNTLARALHAHWGIGNNDVVALYAPNHVIYPIAIWAAHRLGAIVAMTNPSMTAPELAYQLKIARPRLLMAHIDNLPNALEGARMIGLSRSRIIVFDAHKSSGRLSDEVRSIEEVVESGLTRKKYPECRLKKGEAKTKIAVLCYSSGTTGKPKAVAVSHYNLICNIVQIATTLRVNENYAPVEEIRFRPGDRCAAVLPLYHIYGLVANLHFTLFAGMTVVIIQKYNHENLLRSIERLRITHLFLVPPQVVILCKHPSTRKYDLSRIRFCMIAAAPLTAELTLQVLELMPHIHLGQAYGLTETTAGVSIWPLSQKVGTPGSGGQLIAGTTVKIVKPDGSLAGVDEPGELWVKGGQVALGYYRNPKVTRETFTEDGWHRTGDEVIIRRNGDLFVTDRIKELIKVRGHQVAPAELEGHLLAHPAVVDAGVIGVPDEFEGEVPLAFVVLHHSARANIAADPEKMRAMRESVYHHVAQARSREKWLTGGVEFVEAIPKNASGKILRRVLRERAKTISRRVKAVEGGKVKL